MLLIPTLRRLIKVGTLRLIDADGKVHTIDAGVPDGLDDPPPAVTIRLHDRSLHWKLALNPQLHLGEAYMDGALTVEDGTIYDFLDFCGYNQSMRRVRSPMARFWLRNLISLIRFVQQYNPADRSRRNVAHHYDLNDTLYDLFLDPDRQYSCAYFPHPDASLEEAQHEKKRHIASKLLLEPARSVLDIGSGWGGMALYLAETANVEVTGITLSTEQHQVSERRAREKGVSDRVRFALQDYRSLDQRFDRIVSVGMFEHVGVPHYETYFSKVRGLLTDDGVAVIHSIGRSDGPGVTNAWIRKYIFPGGYIPALSEVLPAIERAGLWVTDIEILRLHYAETLRHWRERFVANWDRVVEIYDERFCRMWEFYLAGSEMAFRHDGMMVFQIQLTKRQSALPLTRDYMVDWERDSRRRGGQKAA